VIAILQRSRNYNIRLTGTHGRIAVAMKAKRTIATRRSNYQVKRVVLVMVGSDMQARLFTLAPRDKIPWHCHSECADHYFVLEGTLTVSTPKLKRAKKVQIGRHYRIAPGTPHLISNRSGADCRFLLLQGVGKCDWIKA
jgi:mannose-6-phosphate isomerase-like protein (cupin superfamily)